MRWKSFFLLSLSSLARFFLFWDDSPTLSATPDGCTTSQRRIIKFLKSTPPTTGERRERCCCRQKRQNDNTKKMKWRREQRRKKKKSLRLSVVVTFSVLRRFLLACSHWWYRSVCDESSVVFFCTKFIHAFHFFLDAPPSLSFLSLSSPQHFLRYTLTTLKSHWKIHKGSEWNTWFYDSETFHLLSLLFHIYIQLSLMMMMRVRRDMHLTIAS